MDDRVDRWISPFGRWMRRTRTKPTAVAEHCGVGVVAVYKWMYGQCVPRPTTAARLLEFTGGALTPNDILMAKRRSVADVCGPPDTIECKAA